MRRPDQPRARRRAGLTLVELVVAAGLATLLFVALFSVLEDFLSLWDRSEERRALAEETSGVLELLAEDLAVLEAGRRGDFVGEWVLFDTDGDEFSDGMEVDEGFDPLDADSPEPRNPDPDTDSDTETDTDSEFPV